MIPIVLTPASSKRLTTTARARMGLGLSEASASEEQLQLFIDQCSDRAAKFCRRVFGRETIRERFDLCQERLTEAGGILVDRSPVFRVVSAAIDGVAVPPENFLIADGRELFMLQDGDTTRWRGRLVSMVYEAGWLLPGQDRDDPPTTAPDLPESVEQAVIQLVGVALSASGRDFMVKNETVDGVGSTSFYVQGSTASLPHPEAEAALAEYRRLAFA